VTTGAISWPAILKSESFAPQRAQIEQLIQQHLSYGEPQANTASEIARAIDRWSATLRRACGAIPRDEYLASQKFLMGLKYSAAANGQNVAKTQPVVPQAVPGGRLAQK
jgi:hypothetical protein